eukprot:scaffold1819_cov311-Prasinococcus_capsulatus_cf.AAC.1
MASGMNCCGPPARSTPSTPRQCVLLAPAPRCCRGGGALGRTDALRDRRQERSDGNGGQRRGGPATCAARAPCGQALEPHRRSGPGSYYGRQAGWLAGCVELSRRRLRGPLPTAHLRRPPRAILLRSEAG